jgi:hypothetical protein
MKRIIATFALFAAAAIGPVTRVSAQEPALKATVPFDFTVGDQLLPPGTYQIITPVPSSRVLIEIKGKGISAYAFVLPNNKSTDGQTKLVFDKVDGQYFLKEVVSGSITAALPKSDLEKRVQMLRGPLDSGAETAIPGDTPVHHRS